MAVVTLFFKSSPTGALITVPQLLIEKRAAPLGFAPVKEGRFQYTAELPGYETKTGYFTASKTKRVTVNIEMQPLEMPKVEIVEVRPPPEEVPPAPPAPPTPPPAVLTPGPFGALSITSTPSGADVWLPEAQQSGKTPFFAHAHRSGNIQFSLKLEGYKSVLQYMGTRPKWISKRHVVLEKMPVAPPEPEVPPVEVPALPPGVPDWAGPILMENPNPVPPKDPVEFVGEISKYYALLTGRTLDKSEIEAKNLPIVKLFVPDMADVLSKVFLGRSIYAGEAPEMTVDNWIDTITTALVLVPWTKLAGALKTTVLKVAPKSASALSKLAASQSGMVNVASKVGQSADDVAKAISEPSGAEIVSRGIKDPKALLKWFKGLSQPESTKLFETLSRTPIGRDGIAVLQRLVLDSRIIIPKWAKIAGVIGAGYTLYQLAHTLNFMGFLGEESIQTVGIGVFALINNKLWKPAHDSLIEYEKSVLTIIEGVDELAAVPALSFFLNLWWPGYKAGALKQIEDYKTTIAAGLASEAVGTTITVTTEPPQALASIPGIFLEKITPFTVNIAPGSYDLLLEKEGYKPKTKTAIIKENQDNPVSVALEEISPEVPPNAGRLIVAVYDEKTGMPIKATLYIDNEPEKFHLHSYALDLVPGVYEIRVEEPGYEIETDTVGVEKGLTTDLKVELGKIEVPPWEAPPEEVPPEELPPAPPAEGTLQALSDPAAEIWIAGIKKADKTPASIQLGQGVYDITFKAEGYVSETKGVIIRPGETSTLSITLQEEGVPALERELWRVDVDSEPSGAKILINDSFTDAWTPGYVLLEPGVYELSLVKSGYKRWSTPLVLEEI